MTLHTHQVGNRIVTYTLPDFKIVSIKTQSGADASLLAAERDEIVAELRYYWKHNKETQ